MLQRAASNAYTWWWASHIRTKQSKWLEQNVQDMEDKVKYMLKLIEEDGDSFARRAEMYYRKRPELINFVEESYRAYRALADRYDHLSGELQNANNTIASVFPEQVQFPMDDEDDDGSPKKPNSSANENSIPKALPLPPKLNIPKIPSFRRKDAKDTSTLPRKKVQPKKAKSTSKGSQIRTEEALQKIDRLQKGILALQTEKEFVKSSFESGVEKYWEIEKQINEMQEQVCTLQDEFGVATVIEDDDARTIMAATALKSCQETLVQLQEKQEQSAEEARAEYQRIIEAHEKLQTIKNEFLGDQMDQPDLSEKKESVGTGAGLNNLEQEFDLRQERLRLESIQEKIRQHFDMSSDTFLTVTELAEKIDELVHEVISLETAVSSQNALIRRIRSETDELQENLRNLDDGKASSEKGPDKLTGELRKLDEKLIGIQDLHQSVEDQNNNLQTHFTETRCNLHHLSEKLHSVKPDEEIDVPVSPLADMGIVEAQKQKMFRVQKDMVSPDDGLESTKARKEDAAEEKSSVQSLSPYSKDNEGIFQSMESNSVGDASEKCEDLEHQKIVEKQGMPRTKDESFDINDSPKDRKEDAAEEKSSVQSLSPYSKDNEGIIQSMESNRVGDASEKCEDPEHQKIVEKQGMPRTKDESFDIYDSPKDNIEKQEPFQTEDHIDAHSQGICDLNHLGKELDSVQPGEEILGSSMDKAEKQDLFPTEEDDISKIDTQEHSNLNDLSEKPHFVKSDSSMDNIERQKPSQIEDNAVDADSKGICDLNYLGKELHLVRPGEEILGSSMDKAEKQDLFPTEYNNILKVDSQENSNLNDLSEKPHLVKFGESADTNDSSKDNIEKQVPSQTEDHIVDADSQGWDPNFLAKEIRLVKPGEEIMGSSKGKAETQNLFPPNLNCNLNHFSEKQDSSLTDEVVKISPQAETGALIDDGMQEKWVAFSDEPENSKESTTEAEDKADEVQNSSIGVKNDEDGDPSKLSNTSNNNMPDVDSDQKVTEEEAEGEPNWEKLFLSGLENREKVLLLEYTTILRTYKDTKKQLSEIEKRNRETNVEMMVQLKELKRANATKDDEIKSLRQKLGFLQTSFEGNLETNNTEFKNTQQGNHQTLINSFDDQNVEAAVPIPNGAMETNPTTAADEEEKIKAVLVDEPHVVATIEEKFRRDIDELLEENLEFWLRFSTLFHQIQKFQSSIQDLEVEITKLKDGKKEGSTSKSLKSDAWPIYKHLREIQTELTVWLENNALLKEELQQRFTSLCDIQEEISRVSNAGSETEEVEFPSYQAAKFHGEVLNMQQENNKVADELQAGLEHVRGLQHEIEKTITKLNEDFELSGTKNNHHHARNSGSKSRVPLRSFIFGVKNKKQRPSIFRCINPALQKQYSDLTAAQPP